MQRINPKTPYYPSSQHPETRFAIWMRNSGALNGSAVINNDYVCGPPLGCQPAVEAILPPGSKLTIYFDGGSIPLYGKSQIPLP